DRDRPLRASRSLAPYGQPKQNQECVRLDFVHRPSRLNLASEWLTRVAARIAAVVRFPRRSECLDSTRFPRTCSGGPAGCQPPRLLYEWLEEEKYFVSVPLQQRILGKP